MGLKERRDDRDRRDNMKQWVEGEIKGGGGTGVCVCVCVFVLEGSWSRECEANEENVREGGRWKMRV